MILSKDLYFLGDDYLTANSRSTNRTSVKGHSTFSNMKSNSANEKETQNFLNHHLHQHHHHHHHHHHHNHQNNYHHDYHHDSHHHHGQQRGVDLVFKNISVSVTTKLPGSLASFDKITQEKLILHDISGYAKPGQILSVMGPSGSGKTTLLSALGGRLKPTCGCITLNGETLNKQIKRKIGYVLQQDIFFTGLTLRQTLMYTAQLRLSDSLSYSEKKSHVEKIIDILDLRHCQDTIIGDIMKRGLSGGEKKRANIACELLTNPTVMLIDEPTSGLDSSTAHNLMQTLKDFAVKEKKTIIATVHQPSSQMFHMFDKLLLLCNGRMAYFGDVNQIVPFFQTIGFEISPHYNPADFIMEKVNNIKYQDKIINAAKDLLEKNLLPQNHINHNHIIANEDDLVVDNNVITKQSSYNHHHHHDIINNGLINDSKLMNESQNWHHDHHQEHHHDHHQEHHHDHHQEHHHDNENEHNSHDQDHHHEDNENNSSPKSLELRVVIDPNDKKVQKVYNKIVADDDSGRSSWSGTDRCSSAFSSNSYIHEICVKFTNSLSNGNEKWPTSFWTQVKVLTQRNFYEAKNRMLSKLNWIQTIALAIVAGLIWFQVVRKDNTLNDIKGWMYFTSTYWMLFALFSVLISFPSEREVINKERSSGAYRLSSYYIAKMIGELPLTITLPSVFYFISYPMMGCYNVTTFLSLWGFLILSTICAQSVGLFIGASCTDLEVSVTLSALYSLSTMLFAGYYATSMPSWLSWMRYCSMIYYAFQSMQIVEFSNGPPILCSSKNSQFSSCAGNSTSNTIPYSEVILYLDNMNAGQEPLPLWINTLILIMFLVVFRLSGYYVLRFLRKPK